MDIKNKRATSVVAVHLGNPEAIDVDGHFAFSLHIEQVGKLSLESEGFKITENVAGMPTAVIGEAGDEGPVIAILGEFDALPGLSQQPGVAKHQPIEDGANGHGCHRIVCEEV